MLARLEIPVDASKPLTDYTRWRLKIDEAGNHTWHYLSEEQLAAWPQSKVDKYWIGLQFDTQVFPKAQDALSAARNGFEFYKNLQSDDGHWSGEYSGPHFLTPGLVIGSYVTGMDFALQEKLEMIRYLMNTVNEDGGWGIHVEGHSTVFGTALNYVVLRLLGMDADHPTCVKARGCLHALGGAVAAPSWGKFWLAVLNVYEWDGQNSIPPELFLLPEWTPVHPHKFWIHLRQVFIPMSFIYAKRWRAPRDPLIMSLREELYVQDYRTIDWPAQRNNVHPVDMYNPHSAVMDALYLILVLWERAPIQSLRNIALDRAYNQIVLEDENTEYQCLGPVNKMVNQVARYIVDGRESPSYEAHKLGRQPFMWLGKEGMMMRGTNGSQLWDITFITQAMVESGLAEEAGNRESMLNALGWLDRCQILENPKHYESAYRHTTKGAWPFSTKTQGYTVSDCTAEGLKSVLYIQEHLSYAPKLVDERRLCDAVDVLLSMQNAGGGFASYELIRTTQIIEKLNPAEVFGNIMTEYAYPECTTSVITALSVFKKYYPKYRAADIKDTTRKAIQYLHDSQRPEGGWFGSWGICFTYATMFALESLSLVGESYRSSARVKKACDFLVSKQMEDGGWGESYKSCEQGIYVQHERSQVVQTAWAGLALMYAGYPMREPLERGDGSWAQEAIEGVFNKNVAIGYPNFKFSFTIWMLGRAHQYLETLGKVTRT
ncbi:Lanosterol synthase (Oxidosqualene--lanosterol cyclase) [Tulasnella sp. 330]|nr:Lanosterol synthase (Oxidosqualene--lanosterol cyclase) [Tulasnella sp. 330]KAG8880526.1 Lanosterol synthase (Oxidosqualene--lanosterol cyclase) [Tulasnella sp. 332]KAG8880905.1 Lanosterol synthase (Oxidosqualene--lanosterol cyclase) [Tulasnella sp. 331]